MLYRLIWCHSNYRKRRKQRGVLSKIWKGLLLF